MKRSDAVAEIKTHLQELLEDRGIDVRRPFTCLNPSHEDKNPSMSFDASRNRAKCFSCGAAYDALSVIGQKMGYVTDLGEVEGNHFNEVLKEACSRFNINLDDSTANPSPNGHRQAGKSQKKEPAHDSKEAEDAAKVEYRRKMLRMAQAHIEDPEVVAYLTERRGISLETAKRYGLGFLPSFKTGSKPWKALIIPTGNGKNSSYTARNLYNEGHNDRIQNRGPADLFNLAALDGDSEAVYITEGELDALSVIEAGGAAIGLGSTSHVKKLVEALETRGGNDGKTLIIALDNDREGMKAAQDLSEGIKALGLGIKTKRLNISGDYKDPNEALTNDTEGFKTAIRMQRALYSREERELYLQSSAAGHLVDFYKGVNESANTPAISTGFYYLDKALDGGLYEGLYTMPAITSLGKTTFALQMADQIAKQGKDVLFVSMEMAEAELIAKSLSRQTFLKSIEKKISPANAKTVRGITDGKRYEYYTEAEQGLIMDAYNAYSEYAGHLYIKQGVGDITAADIREEVAKHIALTGNAPVVFVDYVQILAPMDKRATDKQNMDSAVLELKRISRDYKTPVIIISSINRSNYEEEINFTALKESGALEYTSDVVMGLQYQGVRGMKGKKAADIKKWVEARINDDPRHVDLVILKNRNGEPGKHLSFDYYKLFNYFNEQSEPAITDEDAAEGL